MFQRTARCAAGVLVAVSMGRFALAGDWPQWRGPARDGIVGCFTAPSVWPEKLKKVWSIEAGAGDASPLVAGGKIYLHARQGGNETVSAFDLASGKLLWRDSYPASQGLSATPALDGGVLSALGVDPILPAIDPAAGKDSPAAQAEGPYATPTLDGGVLYAFGVNTILSAYDPAVGKLLWRRDFARELPTPRPNFGTSASPLVVDGMVVVQVGGSGKGAVVALDAKTGGFRWRLVDGGPSYGSPVAATFGGVRQVIVPTEKTILGAALATGEKLWEMPFPVPYDQNMLTPLVVGDTFIMSGSDTDTQAIRVSRKDGTWVTEKVWANRSISMSMSSPVLADGLLCGFSSFRRGHVFCADPGTGEVRWKTEGGEGESAAVVASGNHLFILRSDAELQVIRKTGGEIRKIAQYTVADATTWATPVLLDGRILVKDAKRLTLWSLG